MRNENYKNSLTLTSNKANLTEKNHNTRRYAVPKFQKDPETQIVRIEQLVTRVESGDIKLPKFQRPFIWKRQECLKLWDSIYQSYPISSMLLWLTEKQLANEKEIGGVPIAAREHPYPTNYLLDGQQRLSTLCGALYWDGEDKESMWNICFDLINEKFLYPKYVSRPEYFPLNKLLNTKDFLAQCRTFDAYPMLKDEFYARATKLLSAVKDYLIPVVTLFEMELNEVAPIFERINSTGRKLTIFDLIRAATWKDDFDINDTVNEIRESLKVKAFEKVTEVYILRNISASLDKGANKSDIENLGDKDTTTDDLKKASKDCVAAYKLAVDFLTKELPISSYDYLPYAFQLTYLVEYFRLNPSPSFEQRNKLKTWFWKTSIGGYFASSTTTQIANDLSKMRKLAKGEVEDFEIDKAINTKRIGSYNFSLSTAISKAFALILAENKPLSLLDGSRINTFQALSVKNNAEYHHIFPQAYLKSFGVEAKQINAQANICLLTKANNLTILDKAPSKYFPELEKQLGDQLEKVLASNFISIEAYEAGLRNQYDLFLYNRSLALTKAAEMLTNEAGRDAVIPEVEPENASDDFYGEDEADYNEIVEDE